MTSSAPPYELPLPIDGDCDGEPDEVLLPSYFDLYPSNNGIVDGQIKNNTVSMLQYRVAIRHYMIHCCKPVALIVLLLLSLVIPLSMVFMGSIYFHRCTVHSFIPMFLVVFGSVTLSVPIFHGFKTYIIKYFYKDNDNNTSTQTKRNSCEVLAVIFLFVWLIVGILITFITFQKWLVNGRVSCTPIDSKMCCDAPVMYFTVVIIIIIFLLTALTIVIGCVCCCVISCSSNCNTVSRRLSPASSESYD